MTRTELIDRVRPAVWNERRNLAGHLVMSTSLDKASDVFSIRFGCGLSVGIAANEIERAPDPIDAWLASRVDEAAPGTCSCLGRGGDFLSPSIEKRVQAIFKVGGRVGGHRIVRLEEDVAAMQIHAITGCRRVITLGWRDLMANAGRLEAFLAERVDAIGNDPRSCSCYMPTAQDYAREIPLETLQDSERAVLEAFRVPEAMLGPNGPTIASARAQMESFRPGAEDWPASEASRYVDSADGRIRFLFTRAEPLQGETERWKIEQVLPTTTGARMEWIGALTLLVGGWYVRGRREQVDWSLAGRTDGRDAAMKSCLNIETVRTMLLSQGSDPARAGRGLAIGSGGRWGPVSLDEIAPNFVTVPGVGSADGTLILGARIGPVSIDIDPEAVRRWGREREERAVRQPPPPPSDPSLAAPGRRIIKVGR